MLVLGYNWILFMHGWFCPIRLILPIGQKSLYFEKEIIMHEFIQCKFSSTSIELLTNLPFLKKLSMEITRVSLFTHAGQQ